mmetsp:Transcript_35364/g.115205  ORF Transcript_35364/g.115205 Transcript_35364/m.115205 type:complete len:149 (-) Transcript_35364:244-690(-)
MVIDGDEGGGGGEEEEGEDEALRAAIRASLAPPTGASSSASAAPAFVPFAAAQPAALASPPAPLPVRSDDTFGNFSSEEAMVGNLEACGYPREQARWALSRCQGSPRARLNGALDLLLDGGEGGGGSGSGGGSAGTPVSPAKRPLELD